MVVLPPETKLPDGTEVEVVAETDLLPENHPAIAAILKLAKPRPDWPEDFALNHAHYVKGHPKKSARFRMLSGNLSPVGGKRLIS